MLSTFSGKTLACKELKEEDSATRSTLLLLYLQLELSPTKLRSPYMTSETRRTIQ